MRKINIKISAKISLGFGLVTLALIINAILISGVLDNSRQLNEQISHVYQPSEVLILNIRDQILNSQLLIKNLVLENKDGKASDMLILVDLHKVMFPKLKKEVL